MSNITINNNVKSPRAVPGAQPFEYIRTTSRVMFFLQFSSIPFLSLSFPLCLIYRRTFTARAAEEA